MQNLLISLHVLVAIFGIGPLVGAAATAARGVKAGDAAAVASSARTVRIYGYASIAVAVFGLGLVQSKWGNKFSDTWVWLSILLYLAALAVTLGLLVPSLEKAGASIGADGSAAAAASFTGRISAAGGIVSLLFAVIVFLMVYQPGGSAASG